MKTSLELQYDGGVYFCDRIVWLAIPHALNSFEQELREVVDDY